MKNFLFIVIVNCISIFSFAQEQTVRFKVIDAATKQPLENVSIEAQKKSLGKTDEQGIFTKLIAGSITECVFSNIGYETQKVKLIYADTSWTTIAMQKIVLKQDEVTVISSTRNNQKIENAPLKVEVLGREEMDEENTIKPANIASILGDVSGVQIQQTSATTGNANVRIQGLSGQYTQILKDGMPLYEGFSGGFGVLSIPPLDLKQVELIKGSASTLYGGGAIGGLVNIISRKPTEKQTAVITINASTLKEKNANFFMAKKFKKVGYTLFAGYTDQTPVDVNKDGFSDVAETKAIIIHPRLFFYPNKNTTIIVGNNTVIEDRVGGDMNYINKQLLTGASYFFEKNTIERTTTDLIVTHNLKNNDKLELKASYSSLFRNIKTNSHNFNGTQDNFFSELSLVKQLKKSNLVAGANFITDQFRKLTSSPILLNNFGNNTIGLFVQNTIKLNEKTILEAGIRNDFTNHYGSQFLPRIAAIHHLNEAWGLRAGIGFGYKIPNPLNNQITDVPIQTILPLTSFAKAEKSIGYNAEINYKYEWDKNELFINHAFFLTNITSPLVAEQDIYGNTNFFNATKSINTKGFDTYIKLQIDELELYAGFTYTIAERNYLPSNKFIPYTPKTRAAFTAVKDIEDLGLRFGLEGSYNGFQYREDGTKTPDYLFMAALIDKKFGKHFSAVLNCENLLDYRQSKKEALYTGTIANPQFKTLWAPIDGRVINLAVKYSL
jgi:outer membrane receptor for ferrienterochelin and colicins